MKTTAVLLIALGIIFPGCKKNNSTENPVVETDKIMFWAVNVDSSESYKVFGLYMDTVLLKPGEKSKLYESDHRWWGAANNQLAFEACWFSQNPVDTNCVFLTSETTAEIIMLVINKNQVQFQLNKSVLPCFMPGDGQVVLRAVDFKGYNTFGLVNTVKNDTVTVDSKTITGTVDTLGMPCTIIKPGTYEITALSPSLPILKAPGTEFKAGKVYLLYAGHDNKIHVLERN